MSVTDLQISSSFSNSPGTKILCKSEETLNLGCKDRIFLYAEIPPFIGFYTLGQARIILFKLYDYNIKSCCDLSCANYYAYPLLDFYSEFGYMFSPPNIDKSYQTAFYNDPNLCCTEIDITRIAQAWSDGKIENKGVMLAGRGDIRCITYASNRYVTAGMRPFMRFIYDGVTICHPLSVQESAVTVNV